jgi:hypothetical protein
MLYIIQRTPEERYMIVNKKKGVLTLIVWAHYILGLRMSVTNLDNMEDVIFSNNANPNPIIRVQFRDKHASRITDIASEDSVVCLYDKSDELLIRIYRELESIQPIETRERIKLRGYGTIALCRYLDQSLDGLFREPNMPYIVEGAEVLTAMALVAA